MSAPFNIPWMVVPHTRERVLIHKDTGEIIQFTDDIDAPEQEYPIMGLADMFAPEDIAALRGKYTPYELASGGA